MRGREVERAAKKERKSSKKTHRIDQQPVLAAVLVQARGRSQPRGSGADDEDADLFRVCFVFFLESQKKKKEEVKVEREKSSNEKKNVRWRDERASSALFFIVSPSPSSHFPPSTLPKLAFLGVSEVSRAILDPDQRESTRTKEEKRRGRRTKKIWMFFFRFRFFFEK